MPELSVGIDLIDFWKVISVGLAGIFGILGLLTEFKDENKRITKWGIISLFGIVLSTLGGATAQFFDSKKTNEEKTELQVKILELSKANAASLAKIERILLPLGVPQLSYRSLIECEDAKWKSSCEKIFAEVRRLIANNNQPNSVFEAGKITLNVMEGRIDFYRMHIDARINEKSELVNDLLSEHRSESPYLVFYIYAADEPSSLCYGGSEWPKSVSHFILQRTLNFEIDTNKNLIVAAINSGKLYSFKSAGEPMGQKDLSNSCATLVDSNLDLSQTKEDNAIIKLPEGRSIFIPRHTIQRGTYPGSNFPLKFFKNLKSEYQ